MSNASNSHDYYLNLAIKEAKKSHKTGDVPVGAIIVKDGLMLASAHNTKEKTGLPTGHAELTAIETASQALGDWRLTDCTLYTTLEPCPMCAGAILAARITQVIYAAKDLKWGAAGTKTNLFEENLFNHNVKTQYIETPEAAGLLTTFFKTLRKTKNT